MRVEPGPTAIERNACAVPPAELNSDEDHCHPLERRDRNRRRGDLPRAFSTGAMGGLRGHVIHRCRASEELPAAPACGRPYSFK